MGVTAIKWVENRSASTVTLAYTQPSTAPGHDEEIAPRGDLAVDLWIPWAADADAFDGRHLAVRLDGVERFCIWQAAKDDGDFVRFSTDGRWSDPGSPVPGVSRVDGSRTLVVFDDQLELLAQPDTHGVSVIVSVQNAASEPVAVTDRESPAALGSGDMVPPGASHRAELPVPWARDAAEFAEHHLAVAVGGVERFWIWQADRSDGDFVRCSTDGAWHDPGAHVAGAAAAGQFGALVVGDDSIRLEAVVGRPPPQPESGVDRIVLSRPDKSTFVYTGRSQHPDRPARIKTVKNIADDINGKETIPLEVSHRDAAGASLGPIRIEPGEGVEFGGLAVDGDWRAVAIGSNVFLTEGVELEVAWRFDHEVGTQSRVRCVVQDSSADFDRRIQGLGGTLPDGSPWRLDIATAIDRVNQGARLYVEEGGRRSYLTVATNPNTGTQYLKTEADGVEPNNLSALPSCT